MSSQGSTSPAVEEQEQQVEQIEQPQETEEQAPPSPPLSDSESKTPSGPSISKGPRPHHLTTTTSHSVPSFAASTSASSRRAAESSNHNNSLISPAATTASASSIRSRSNENRDRRGYKPRGNTVPQEVGSYANSTFASRQRSVNDADDKKEGKPVWR